MTDQALEKYIKTRFEKKYNEPFDNYYNEYKSLKPFAANGNIFESGQEISERVHFIMRLQTQYYFLKAFESMLIDMDDDNVKEDLSLGNIGTAGRLAKVFCGADLDDDTELGCGRWAKKPRIATFPNTARSKIPITKRVDIISNCSHHTVPFGTLFGDDSYAIVSYVPEQFVLGISKLQRIVNWVAKRYWLQEDLTKAIYDEVSSAVKTKDVYVKLYNIKHGCEFLRGSLSKDGSFTSEYYDGYFNDINIRENIH